MLFFVLLMCELIAKNCLAQIPLIPPDTTVYWKMNESGVNVPYSRGPDSTLYKGQLIIRFKQGALDYEELLEPYLDWYYGYSPKGAKRNMILSGQTLPSDSNRGFPQSLRNYLKLQRFYLDSSSNIVNNAVLKSFLLSSGGKYLRRLTTASPLDKYSVTRRGDTIGCDHYNWFILKYDTTVNPLVLSYLLMTQFRNDIIIAEPDRHVGKLLHAKPSLPKDDINLHNKCQFSLTGMIGANKAWDYQVGNPKIVIAVFDRGADYTHPDLGGTLGLGSHVRFGEQFSINPNTNGFDFINQHQDHGTKTLGIIGALTNRNNHSIAGIAGGWGVMQGDPPGSVDEGKGCSLAILAASNFGENDQAYSDYVASIFHASAKSDSSQYGYGVDAINTSAAFTFDLPSVHASINYAFLNGVVHSVAMANDDKEETIHKIDNDCYPANYEESWVIAVGGSRPDKERISGSDYGYTIDMIAPAGDPNSGDSVWFDQYGKIICSNSNNNNWNMTFSTANIQQDNGLAEVTNPMYTYRGFGGNSAAAPHVSGSAGLLLSQFYNTALKLEPEDVAGILKASAWRGDKDRDSTDSLTYWRKYSGWGHLDIGHAFEMMDSSVGLSTKNLYTLKHFHYEDSLEYGDWSDKGYYFFQICWDPAIAGNPGFKKKYGNWQYLLNDNSAGGTGMPYSYQAKVRTVTRTVTLPNMWVIDTNNSPLFAWGRSGGLDEKSGWNFSQFNWQTGWSRVVSSTGGDTLNESIFHSQGTTFNVVTAQYDVWAWNQDSNDYKTYVGHVPDDTLMGVNFSVFGRKDVTFQSVKRQLPIRNDNISVTVGDNLNVDFILDEDISAMNLEVFDILGKFISSKQIGWTSSGKNRISTPMQHLPSGSYILRLSGDGFVSSKTFQISK